MFHRCYRLPFLAIFVIMVFGGRADAIERPKPALSIGQVWSVKSSMPTPTKVIIGRIETWGAFEAVSVSVIDVPIPPTMPGAGNLTAVSHMPFERSVLVGSLDRLLEDGAPVPPGFDGGYQQWKAAKGGIFTITVAEAIVTVFYALKSNSGAKKN